MFTIQNGSELIINGVIILLYGDTGVGKTSTSLTASKPILFDFDLGTHRSYTREGKDIVRVQKWAEIAGSMKDIETSLQQYDNIIIDTVDTCLEYVRLYIEDSDFKMKSNKLQMYGRMKDEFNTFLSRLTKLGKNVILIAHATSEDKKGEKYIIPRVTGGSRDIINQKADMIGYISMQNNKRTIDFNPTDYTAGKNSAGISLLQLPDYITEPNYFQSIIDKIKLQLNSNVKKQAESVSKLMTYFQNIELIKDVNGLNEITSSMKNGDNKALTDIEKSQIWAKIKERSTSLNCQYHKEEGKFFELTPTLESAADPATNYTFE